MKLSVIVPVYNVEKYIRECLESLLNQNASAEEVEYLIINDGTKDNSQAIIDEYTAKDTRFRSFIKVNGGISDARNYGIERSNGDYILCLDSDDLLADGSIETILRSLESGPDCLIFDMQFFWEGTKETKVVSGISAHDPEMIKAALLSTPSMCNKVVRKELLVKYPFPVGLLYEDLGTSPMVIGDCTEIEYLDKPLYLYRQRSGSIIYTYSEKNRDIFIEFERIFNRYKENGLFDKYHDELEYMVIEHVLLHGNRRFFHSDKMRTLFKESREFVDRFFKNCLKNRYFSSMGVNDKLFVYLSYHNCCMLLKMIISLKGLVK